MLCICPDEGVDFRVRESVCPVKTIYYDELPKKWGPAATNAHLPLLPGLPRPRGPVLGRGDYPLVVADRMASGWDFGS